MAAPLVRACCDEVDSARCIFMTPWVHPLVFFSMERALCQRDLHLHFPVLGAPGGGVTVCENPNTALAHTSQKRVAKQDYEKKIIIIGPHGYGVYLCTNTMQVGG